MALYIGSNTIDSLAVNIINYNGLITNGLVCFLDGGNATSYPGSGNTWYDLSGNGYNATFTSSPTWNNTNGGTMITNGSGGRFVTSGLNLASSNFTVIAASRYTGGTSGRIISGLNNNWLLGHWSNSVLNYYSAGWISSVGVGGSDTNWRLYAGSGVIGGTYKFYVNGVLNTSGTGGTAGPNDFSIGSYGPGGSEFSDGNVAFMLVYNRALSDAEVFKVYQVFRKRVGV